MLVGTLGIRLVLLVGAGVPRPAPVGMTTLLDRVEVTNDAHAGDGFQLTFKLARDAPADFGLLAGRELDPFQRVVIGVLFGASPEVLIDGVITHQQFAPSDEPGASTLSVTGRDVSQALDLEERNEEYPNQPDSVIAAQVIARHATYGLVPQPAMTTDTPILVERIPRQHETDLRFLNRLAQRNGFVFYVEPATFGVNTAYFGPENRLGLPQPALTLGMGASGNLRGISFSKDGLAPVGMQGSFVEPNSKQSIPIPALPTLKVPPLALTPAPALRTVLSRENAQAGAAQAALAAVSAVTNAPDAVTGQGEIDATRYGHALRARRLVGVRGVGFSYDGAYYVSRVTHSIDRGGYRQRFNLSREGTGSLLGVVPT
jgi:hypothetical protein